MIDWRSISVAHVVHNDHVLHQYCSKGSFAPSILLTRIICSIIGTRGMSFRTSGPACFLSYGVTWNVAMYFQACQIESKSSTIIGLPGNETTLLLKFNLKPAHCRLSMALDVGFSG